MKALYSKNQDVVMSVIMANWLEMEVQDINFPNPEKMETIQKTLERFEDDDDSDIDIKKLVIQHTKKPPKKPTPPGNKDRPRDKTKTRTRTRTQVLRIRRTIPTQNDGNGCL